ncbi:MAG: GDP-mannose-dependent alpha-mannosyltransferase [Spirochaetes bacterium ADurb.Bin218]|jgi:glycosyltransferase involved in cell wall biosynthesis|nr:MAG: GDP-mannose-dependent alpha-mannosyltransferase [Spirochaetes bacterium ADurb.Bin218]HOV09122.1 glycosyltransferase family 4 protein [Spirochaetota bacterium]
MNYKESFFQRINREISVFNYEQSLRFPEEESLTIDLHCHDKNSSEPDEIIGRMLNIPETWLEPEKLISILEDHRCNSFTVTNHNNARSCYYLQDKGYDILSGAEFSCTVPDFDAKIHVLAYGFTPAQEEKLFKFRQDIYRFQEYALENEIPTIWAHPLYHYKDNSNLSLDFFDKMTLVFERFEVINGQRDTWQNLLVKRWIESMTPESIERFEKKFCIKSSFFCRDTQRKKMYGGSDSHMGIFTGLTGTKLYVKNLKEKIKTTKISELTLKALLDGDSAPFGGYNNTEKMTVAFLDYFCQIVMNMKDPGLLRLLLHKGDAKDKLLSFLIINGFSELQRHKLTVNFLTLFHQCLQGESPNFIKKIMIPKDYRPVFKEAVSMANTRKKEPDKMATSFEKSIETIHSTLFNLMFERLNKKLEKLSQDNEYKFNSAEELINSLEIPANIRKIFEAGNKKDKKQKFNAPEFLDGLTFPFLASTVISAANYSSSKVMYSARKLLNAFSEKLNYMHYPKRMLWLTDTFDDGNGVSMFLQQMLYEIRKRDLPIDILTCSDSLKSEDNLIVIKPVAVYTPPFYQQQPIRIPNILDIQKQFLKGEYDRILCSTEGPMGLISIYLKSAYTVPAFFFVHTDWITFARDSLKFSQPAMSRLRRILRGFYRSYDRVLVLNKEQKRWFSGPDMEFKKTDVRLTSHWVDEKFTMRNISKEEAFGIDNQKKIMLFVGRISEEKGIMDLPFIYSKVKEQIPDLEIVIAGKGPEEEKLRSLLPEAKFTGWVSHDRLPELYSAADILILPSRFDTFGNVIVEAFSCGCPVVSYNTKGPKDIIENEKSGYLVNTREKMAEVITNFFLKNKRTEMSQSALLRSKDFTATNIIEKLLKDTGLL